MTTSAAGPALSERRWYAVGDSHGLQPEQARAVWLFGQDVVLWRGASGRVHAWDNRCPHRGLRLSLGRVHGDLLTCGYHGWRFDETAACDFIPAHPTLKPSKKSLVPRFSVHDDGALIWLRIGDGEEPVPQVQKLHFCRSLAFAFKADALSRRLADLVFLPAELSGTTPPGRLWRWRDEGAKRPGRALRWQCEGDVARSVSYHSECLAPGLVAVTAEGDDLAAETRVLALQPADDTHAVLHIAVRRDAGDGQAIRLEVARWAARLRWFLEKDGRAAQSYSPFFSEGEVA